MGQPSEKLNNKVCSTLHHLMRAYHWNPSFQQDGVGVQMLKNKQDRQKEDMDIDMDWDEFTDAMTIDWDFFIDEMDLDDLPAPSDNDCMVLDLNDFIEEDCINAITRNRRQYQSRKSSLIQPTPERRGSYPQTTN